MRNRSTRRGLLAAAGAGLLAVALTIGVITNPAQAATLYSDNFDDGNSDGWSKSGGDWSVGTDGSPAYRQNNSGSEMARGFAGDNSWTNYQVQARVKPLLDNSGSVKSIVTGGAGAGRIGL